MCLIITLTLTESGGWKGAGWKQTGASRRRSHTRPGSSHTRLDREVHILDRKVHTLDAHRSWKAARGGGQQKPTKSWCRLPVLLLSMQAATSQGYVAIDAFIGSGTVLRAGLV